MLTCLNVNVLMDVLISMLLFWNAMRLFDAGNVDATLPVPMLGLNGCCEDEEEAKEDEMNRKPLRMGFRTPSYECELSLNKNT